MLTSHSFRRGRNLAAALGGAAVFLLPAAGCQADAATPATIGVALATARAGDTIKLTGHFATLDIRGRKWARPVTLDATGASFVALLIRDSSGLIVRGGTWRQPENHWAGAILVAGSDHVSIHNPEIVNAGTAAGVTFRDSTDVVLDGARIDRAKVAVSLLHVTGAKIRNTLMMRSAIDGIDIASSHQVLAENNACIGNLLVDEHHPDCIQMWSIQGETPTSDITVRGNLAYGGTQGFTAFSRTGGGFDRIVFEDNTAVVSYPNGVALMSGRQSIIRRNRNETLPGAKYRTHIMLRDSPDTLVCGNVDGAALGREERRDAPCP